jgi:hypothetical protein
MADHRHILQQARAGNVAAGVAIVQALHQQREGDAAGLAGPGDSTTGTELSSSSVGATYTSAEDETQSHISPSVGAGGCLCVLGPSWDLAS